MIAPDDLTPDRVGTTYYTFITEKAVTVAHRFIGKIDNHRGTQPLFWFADERDKAHRTYTTDLLDYFATEQEAKQARADRLVSLSNEAILLLEVHEPTETELTI